MNRVKSYRRVWATLAGLMVAGALLGCSKKAGPTTNPSSSFEASGPNMTDVRRLNNGATKLIDAMNKPTTSFHFSFKGQENIDDRFAADQTQQPLVAPVALEADISPEELDLVETRGSTKREIKAKWGDETNWAMANVTTLGTLTNPNLVIAVASGVATPPVADLVGLAPADEYTFDTSAATPSQKVGLKAARMVLSTIKDCKGTAWISKDSGVLIKFNIDADYVDRYNRAWREHYEGEVTPK